MNPVTRFLWLAWLPLLASGTTAYADTRPDADTPDAPTIPSTISSTIIVTASRADLLGTAATASQGSISQQEVALRPIFRPGQLYESIPGLAITIHSGEGKAQQYLIRGYNLDHGTDFANFIDDMPVNRPTNAHGQGYSDLGFLIPQIVAGIDYTKGPYYAAIGDFGSVASSHTRLVNDLPDEATVTIGTDGYQDVYMGGTADLGGHRRLMAAAQLGHYDGPWQPGQNFRKINAVLRYSEGTARDGLSLTAMAYASAGRLITDQPQRAIDAGLIGRYGTLDPTDYSRSQRYSLSGHIDRPVGPGQLAVSLYAIRSTMTLWNDFTHYLDDPINGDQAEQDETRTTLGAAASYVVKAALGGMQTETVVGFMARYDSVFVDRKHTYHRDTILPICYQQQNADPTFSYGAVGGNCTADRVHLISASPYVQQTIHWRGWLRTVMGLRADYAHATDTSLVNDTGGRGGQWLVQPKGSVILGPWAKTELYFSMGRGFHSNDVRGVFGTVPTQGIPLGGGGTPLLSATTGMEVGLRTNIVPRLSLQLAVFRQDFGSELTYNPDTGQDQSGAPSRRLGVEISAQYHPLRWLELNTDLAFSRPRYHTDNLAAYGLGEPYIADAPNSILSAGVLVDGLGPWSGSLIWRHLGTHSLQDGSLYPQDGGYSEWNMDVGYALSKGWSARIGIFNLLNSHQNAADYYYTARLSGEPAAGVAGFQGHPLEPRAARFSLTKAF